MEHEGSLSHSQQPVSCAYPEPYQSSSRPAILCPKIQFNIILLDICTSDMGSTGL